MYCDYDTDCEEEICFLLQAAVMKFLQTSIYLILKIEIDFQNNSW